MTPPEDREPATGKGAPEEPAARDPITDAIDEAIDAGGPARAVPMAVEPRRSPGGSTSSGVMQRLRSDPETVERDLVKLVLTLVELVRQLIERQALRRVDEGGLDDDQVERLGLALMRLEEAMTRLKTHFELDDHELNIDLGPLGPLLPER